METAFTRRFNTYGRDLYREVLPPPEVPVVQPQPEAPKRRKLRKRITPNPFTARFNTYGRNLYQAFLQQEFKTLLSKKERKNKKKNTAEVPTFVPEKPDGYRGSIRYDLEIQISSTKSRRRGAFVIEPNENLWDTLLKELANRTGQDVISYGTIWFILDPPTPVITFRDMLQNTETELNYAGIRMLDAVPLNLSVNVFNNIVNIKPTNESCVPTALRTLYPEISKQKKDPIAKLHNANTEEITEFCKQYSIRMMAYNHLGVPVAKYIPEKYNTKYKTLIYIIYDGHIHIVKNRELTKQPVGQNFKHLSAEDLDESFRSLIQRRIVPSNIRLNMGSLVEYTHEDTRYIYNPDWELVNRVVDNLGIFNDTIEPTTNATSLMSIIEKYYTSHNPSSFLPIQHSKPAFFWNAEYIDKTREQTCIDKNLAYTDNLKELPYLLTTDIRTHDHEFTSKYTTENALYIAEANPPNVLLPRKDIYSGQHIKFCIDLKAFPVKIYEKLECKKEKNYFKVIIEDLLQKLDRQDLKQVVLRAIGSFEKNLQVQDFHEVNFITKQQRTKQYENIAIDNIPDGYFQLIPTKQVRNLYNRKPIAIQIKDAMFRALFTKMNELNLKDQDIIQINTDSITFYTKPKQEIKSSNLIGAWKISTSKLQTTSCFYDNCVPFETFVQHPPFNNNLLVEGCAGNGKSYRIQNKTDLTDSIIVSSKHSAIRQHREQDLNARVIQAYTNISVGINKIPAEQHIIVEECGILTREHWDFLVRCSFLGKKLSVLGDFSQLLPFGEQSAFDKPLFLNWLFNTREIQNTNWRNDFPISYYDWLKHKATNEERKHEVLKYSTKKPTETDSIIAYRNIIVDKYNELMLEHHGKTRTSEGVPIMIKTNDFREQDIFNNFIFQREELQYDDEALDAHFEAEKVKVAYARTLYNYQGDETPSYFVAPEDIDWFCSPRMAYTLISRLKGKVYQPV